MCRPDSSSSDHVSTPQRVLGHIYYDLNRIGKVRKQVREGKARDSDLKIYWHECKQAENVIRKAVNQVAGLAPGSGSLISEYTLLVHPDYLGWDGLAIAAYSEAFRRILLDQYYDPVAKRVRDTVLEALRDEISSLVFYGRMRNIDWRGLLLPYSNDNLRHMEDALQLTKKFWDRHPHTVALPAPGRTRPQAAIYEECRQINIEENIFDVRDWTNGNGGPETNGHVPRNPTLRAESNYDLGVCDFCRSSHICRCRVRPDPSELVELVVTEGMGIGVRALWPFRKGDILGEYLGRLLPHDAVEDKTYCLMWEAKTAGTSKQVAIDACFEGNWTRFVNHSCSASTAFKSRTFGDRAAMTLEATRDIAMYEEITVNYGFRYWQHRTCLCGEPNCISKRPKTVSDEEESTTTEGIEETEGAEETGQEGEEGEEIQGRTAESDNDSVGGIVKSIEFGPSYPETYTKTRSRLTTSTESGATEEAKTVEDGNEPDNDDHKDKDFIPEEDSEGEDELDTLVVEESEAMDLSE